MLIGWRKLPSWSVADQEGCNLLAPRPDDGKSVSGQGIFLARSAHRSDHGSSSLFGQIVSSLAKRFTRPAAGFGVRALPVRSDNSLLRRAILAAPRRSCPRLIVGP